MNIVKVFVLMLAYFIGLAQTHPIPVQQAPQRRQYATTEEPVT